MRWSARGVAVCLVFAARAALAEEPSDIGEPCRAASDCDDDLRCLRNVCVDEVTFRSWRDERTNEREREAALPKGYVGGVLGAGPAYVFGQFGGSVQAAIRGGALLDGLDLQIEVSPATTLLASLDTGPSLMLEAAGSVGYLIPMSPVASWVLRVGGGGGFMFDGRQPMGFGELRAEVIGVSIRTSKNVLVEFDAPSYRLLFFGNDNYAMTWMTNVAVHYLF